jgi:hypothetical protein
MALLFEQVRSYCGINTTAQSDDDTLFDHR